VKVSSFDFSKHQIDLNLPVPGEHMIQNAKAAFHVGLMLGIAPSVIKQSLESYSGIGRRFEYLGEFRNAKVYSDFAHHPTEVRVNLEAARQKFADKKIILIYQPHMYSRTKALWNDFVTVLRNAPVDEILLLDIYKAREETLPGISSELLAQEINKENISHIEEESLKEYLEQQTDKDTILLFFGAGPIDALARELIDNTDK
jgi:UDP-N-acetylmuramate--alanine ligase